MAHFAERLRLPPGRRRLLLGAVPIGIAALWLVFARPEGSAIEAGMTEQSLVVSPRPFSASIGFVGTIMAGDAVGIPAPFDGVVKKVGFTYGDHVVPGQMIAELDLSELQRTRNEAEGALLKATQASADMMSWESGPEVSRARRAAASAAYDLAETDRKISETKVLFDKGIVPRSEYDGLLQQRRSQQMAIRSAQEDLGTTLARGQGVNRRVAMLELANARARYAQIKAQFEGAIVRAPEAGIIVRPPSQKLDSDDGVRIGTHLSKGQLIGSVARSGGLAVAFRIDEGDVNQLKLDLPVTVTGPGFGGASMTGKIVSVAGEADGGATATTGKAVFAAVAHLDPLAPEQARQIRIGMSANIAITTYTNAAALVVPPQAVRGVAPDATVSVRDQPGGATRAVTVQIGRVSSDGVEILSGLKPGETVVWTVPQAPTATP